MEQLVRQQFDRYKAWLEAMDRADVERRPFLEAGGDLLRPAWNPVRLNRQGTVELRGMDSNFPEVILTVAGGGSRRGRQAPARRASPWCPTRGSEPSRSTERSCGCRPSDTSGASCCSAPTAVGTADPELTAYVDSVLDFVGDEGGSRHLLDRRRSEGAYPTTEAGILEEYHSEDGRLSEDEGLRLVLDACDELEAQASDLPRPASKTSGVP